MRKVVFILIAALMFIVAVIDSAPARDWPPVVVGLVPGAVLTPEWSDHNYDQFWWLRRWFFIAHPPFEWEGPG